MTDQHPQPPSSLRLGTKFRRRTSDADPITLPDLDALTGMAEPARTPPPGTANEMPASAPSAPVAHANPAQVANRSDREKTTETSPAIETPDASASDRQPRSARPQRGPKRAAKTSSAKSGAWHYQADAWRLTRRLTPRQVDLVLRLRSGRAIPAALRARIASLGIPDDVIDETLGDVRRLGDWSDAWIETAQRYLGEFRRNVSAGNQIDGARLQAMAALCYHVAQFVPDPDDARTVSTCRATAASLFHQALPYVHPNAARVMLPWRTKMLPGYLLVPDDLRANDRRGLVVLLNGSTTAKEAMLTWALPLVRSGLAILALDNPGTGEASRALADPDQNDLLDGLFTLFANDPRLDLSRVIVAGLGIGGNLAVRCAISDRRIAAVTAITPPVTPSRWVGRTQTLFHHDVLSALGDAPEAQERLQHFDLDGVIAQVKCPVLVIGAGRDILTPPNEAQRLAEMIGPLATLDWFSTAGHGVYDHIAACMHDLTIWSHAIFEANAATPAVEGESRQHRSLAIATAAREALMNAPTFVEQVEEGDDADLEGARLLADDEILDDDPDWYDPPRSTPPANA